MPIILNLVYVPNDITLSVSTLQVNMFVKWMSYNCNLFFCYSYGLGCLYFQSDHIPMADNICSNLFMKNIWCFADFSAIFKGENITCLYSYDIIIQ